MVDFRIGRLVCFGLLVGCANFPDLNSAATEQGKTSGFPRLMQVDALVGIEAGETERIENIAKSLTARARQLRRRARALRGPIMPRRERAKLLAALARHPIANSG